MCLATITKTTGFKRDAEVTAYRVFRRFSTIIGRENETVYFPLFQGNGEDLPLNRWIDEVDYRQDKHFDEDREGYIDVGDNGYFTGFHAFFRLKDALSYQQNMTKEAYSVLARVKLRDITAQGICSDGIDCYRSIVAQQMLIEKVYE